MNDTKKIMAAVAVLSIILVALGIGIYRNIQVFAARPGTSTQEARKAIAAHDLDKFQKYVDTDRLLEQAAEQILTAQINSTINPTAYSTGDIQKRYEDFVFTTLSQDLTAFPKVKNIIFNTPPGVHSPIVKNEIKKYPIMRDLVTRLQTNTFRIYAYYFGFYRPDLKKCSNRRVKYRKVILNNAHHKFTQINDACVEINIK